jgi:hypothetical protein
LISPQISLPSLPPDEKLELKFWHWFRLTEWSASGPDEGLVQIKASGDTIWQTIAGPFSGGSPVWTQVCIDLSAYAGSAVRLGFYFTSSWADEDCGWFIDVIAILKGKVSFNTPENFELGVGDWSADNGLWEVGIPTDTLCLDSAHSGFKCAGTILAGNYPSDANTRLISPEISLTPKPGMGPELYFWHWFLLNEWSASGPDEGSVQIKVKGDTIWQTLAGPFSGSSPVWSQVYVDLSAYAGSTVRVGFYFTSSWADEDCGWYIDDVRIEGITTDVSEPPMEANVPKSFTLYQNYPNPFNPKTTIKYCLPKPDGVCIEVYNILGQQVATLLDSFQPAGYHSVDWNAEGLCSGIYFYKITTKKFTETKKMILLR